MANQTAEDHGEMDTTPAGLVSKVEAITTISAVGLDGGKMANANPKAPLRPRSVSCPAMGRLKHQPSFGQVLRPGRFEALTPAQSAQQEQERRAKLIGWFERRKATPPKAKASSCKFNIFF